MGQIFNMLQPHYVWYLYHSNTYILYFRKSKFLDSIILNSKKMKAIYVTMVLLGLCVTVQNCTASPLSQWNQKFWDRIVKNQNVDAWRALGVHDTQIYTFYRYRNNFLNAIRNYFKFGDVRPIKVYDELNLFLNYMEHIDNKYASVFNNVILGNGVDLVGNDNFIGANLRTVRGNENYAFTNRKLNVPLVGDNILRVGKFQVDLQRVEQVQWNPSAAIRII